MADSSAEKEFAETRRLIASFLSGQSRAVRRIEGWVRRAASPFRQRLGEDWHDVVQEALLELTLDLRDEKFRGPGSLQPYVWRLVNHACIDRLRARVPRHWVALDDLDLPSADRSPLWRLAQREAIEDLMEIFHGMPKMCQDLWRLIVEGKSYREMSHELGVADGTLRVRVLRCRQKATALRLVRKGTVEG